MKWRFWRWLILGLDGRRSGLSNFLDWWLPVHLLVAIGLAYLIKQNIADAASTVLLPLASIFIGLSFAWAGNAQALLQEREIEKLAENHPDGLETYIYTFQLAILVILVTLVAWGMAGLKVFETPPLNHDCAQFFIKTTLYFLASLTLRECWHVVLGSQMMILLRHRIKKMDNGAGSSD